MDHFLLPERIKHYITIPYKCIEPYDNGDFHTYPDRKGWSADDVEGKDGYGGRRPEEVETFFQTWLFFGCLVEVFKTSGVVVNTEDFIDRDRGVITTKTLMGLLSEWRETWPKEISYHMRSDPRAVAASAILNETCRVISSHCYDDAHKKNPLRNPSIPSSISASPLSPEVIASILALERTLRIAASNFYMDLTPFNRVGGSFLLRSQLKEKWCPLQVTWMMRDMEIDGHYYLAALPGLPQVERARHAECTDVQCREKGVDERSYVLKHAIAGCKCEEVVVPDDVLDIIKRGGTPIISVVKGDGEVPAIAVSEHNAHEGITPPYIALSHVWSDGMGNPNRNALPGCLLTQIQQAVDQVQFQGREENNVRVGFWMDTLCIPVNRKYSDLRKLSIIKMRHIYQEASAALVLESQLQLVPSTAGMMDRCVCLYLTKWRRRVWTYQEGGLAKELFIQFRDKPMLLHHVYSDSFVKEHAKEPDVFLDAMRGVSTGFISDIQGQFGLLQGALLNWKQQGEIAENRWKAFMPVTSSFISRATTRLSDETLCMATVLDIDSTPLVKIEVSGQEKDDQELSDRRMEWFLREIGRFHEGIIFNMRPRLLTEGYRWAPRSFIGGYTGILSNNYESYKEYGQDQAFVHSWGEGRSDTGLQVALPGIIFGPMSPEFRLSGNGRLVVEAVELEVQVPARYIVQLASNENGQYFIWNPEVLYCLVLQRPPKMGATIAMLGQQFSADIRVRHECLAWVELLSDEHESEGLPMVSGGAYTPQNRQWLVV